MGVSIYVMPLSTYLTGRFRVSWEGPLGGEPSRTAARPGLDEDEALSRIAALRRELGVDGEWDEGAPVQAAVAMGYESFGRAPRAAAAGTVLAGLEAPSYWIPLEFEGWREVADPRGGEGGARVASSLVLRRDLASLLRRQREDERMAELESGEAVSGLLAQFVDEVKMTRRLEALAALGVRTRLPVIVEE